MSYIQTINQIVNSPKQIHENAEYSHEEIEIANKTSRNSGAIGKKAIVPKYVLENVEKTLKVLDFGAGKTAAHTQMLRDEGFEDVTAFEFGSNLSPEYHDKNALKKKYDVIFASNVLNVQSSEEMLDITLDSIYNSLKRKGTFICNLPMSPRKFDELDSDFLLGKLDDKFSKVERVGGTTSAPLYKCTK